MILSAFLSAVVGLSSLESPINQANALDPLMLDVTEGCLLPDLANFNPDVYFQEKSWLQVTDGWVKNISDARVFVQVRWPSSEAKAAACSFYSADLQPEDFYGWFQARIGDANDRAWDAEKRYAIWKINTNDHAASIFVARDKSPENNQTVSVIHILQ